MKRQILCVILAVALAVGLLAGCEKKTGENGKGSGQNTTAMGRYLEEEVSLPEGLATLMALVTLEDGRLRILGGTDTANMVYDSSDSGKTWKEVCQIALQEQDYVTSATLSPTGEIGLVSMRGTEDGGAEYIPFLADEQGQVQQIPLALPGSESRENREEAGQNQETGQEDQAVGEAASAASSAQASDGSGPLGQNWVSSLKFAADGNLYVMDMEQNIYRIQKETGEIEKTYSFGSWVDDFLVLADRMMVVADGKVEYYDLESGENLGVDQNMTDQLGASLESGYMVSGIFPVLFLRDGEEALYFCNDGGMYRHVMEGNISEQIIDGALNSLANPSVGLIGMGVLEDGSFAVGVAEGEDYKILHYVYSKDTPSRPSTEVKVYSLRDHTEIRQAISMYQKENPDVFVSLEIGVSGEDGVTVSDALRTLNTNIAAGKGPDILVLDGMPVDSYIEKGLLADLSQVTQSIGEQEGMYENIADTYRTQEGLFAVPSRFSIPVIQAGQKALEGIDSLKTLADTAQKLREENQEAPAVLESGDMEELVNTLYYLDSASWQTEDGTFDQEKIAQFYTSLKQIYDLDEHGEEEGAAGYFTFSASGGQGNTAAMRDLEMGAIQYFYGSILMNVGALSDMNSFSTVTSVNRSKEGSGWAFTDEANKTFIPSQILGILSNSQNAQAAEAFVTYLLSAEAQTVNQGGGFPVNREGFANSLEDKSGVENTEMAVADEEGSMVSLSLSWPDEGDIQALQDSFEELSIPVEADEVVIDAVTEQGVACLEGTVTPQEAAENALQKIQLYLAE